MSNEFKISLGISNLRKCFNLNLDYKTASAKLNEKPFEMDVRPFMEKVLKIVADWPENLADNSILDGLAYHVYVQKDAQIKKYQGKNKFPSNFFEFIKLLDEVGLW